MVRIILPVLAGYVVMAVLVMISFGLVFVASDFALQKDALAATPAFVLVILVADALAAMVGGYVAAIIAAKRARTAVARLAGLVLVLGLVSAVAGLNQPEPTASPEQIAKMTVMERASRGKEPLWYAFSQPFLGGAGVVAGGALRLRRM
jgi:low temperature requirement protein LtrA